MARSFNGTSDKITTPSASYFPGSGAARSLSLWFNCAVLPVAYAGIFLDTAATSGPLIYIKSTGALAIYPQQFGQLAVSQDPLASSTVSINTWHNVVLVSDGTTTFKVYLDGTQLLSESQVSNSAFGSSVFVFGNDNNTAGRFFNGSIADVALWEAVALSAGEVLALAMGTRPSKIRPASLQGWWPLDGLVSPEVDLSRLARNATLTGTAKAFGPPIMPFTPRWPIFSS
jgi:hypothetical protein